MENRTPLIAGNWKMHKTGSEAAQSAKQLVNLVSDIKDVEVMIAPTYTSLYQVSEIIKGSSVQLSAQNIHWEPEGAYTGEISAGMLADAGCRYVIIGHSERRQFFGETDETVNKRIKAAIDSGLAPVFCIGETKNQREANKTLSVLDKQVKKGLEGFSVTELERLVIAYEPVWAIGTGLTATPDQVQDVHKFLRSLIEKNFSSDLAKSVRILYGGSVKPANIKELMALPDVDGALVGGASLKPETFSEIIHY